MSNFNSTAQRKTEIMMDIATLRQIMLSEIEDITRMGEHMRDSKVEDTQKCVKELSASINRLERCQSHLDSFTVQLNFLTEGE